MRRIREYVRLKYAWDRYWILYGTKSARPFGGVFDSESLCPSDLHLNFGCP